MKILKWLSVADRFYKIWSQQQPTYDFAEDM